MKLKLAEYKDGKFESFRELGKDFAFCGDYVLLCEARKGYFEDRTRDFEYDEYYLDRFNKDKKDPLNRFDGLFDGRTFGEGRFVLVKNHQDDVLRFFWEIKSVKHFVVKLRHKFFESQIDERLGNIHENPELWGKVK